MTKLGVEKICVLLLNLRAALVIKIISNQTFIKHLTKLNFVKTPSIVVYSLF